MTAAHTPIGSRRINEVWSFMYSPADLPSRWRAAPAKNRIWSTSGGISSAMVTATGLPVFSHSTRTRSSARASKASAMRNRARLRSDGVASRHPGKAVGRRGHGRIDVLGPGHRGLEVLLAGARVDQHGRGAVRRSRRTGRRRSWTAGRFHGGPPPACGRSLVLPGTVVRLTGPAPVGRPDRGPSTTC